MSDVNEVLEELAGQIFIARVLACQFDRDLQHVQAVHSHPTGAVGLFDVTACRQRSRTIEDADVIQSQEATLENITAFGVLAIDPPREVQDDLLEYAV